MIVRAAAWNKANAKRRAEIVRKYGQQEHVKARARLRNYDHAARDYVAILALDPCCYCGVASDHIDHIEPISCGGPNTSDNLTAACMPCNVVKSAKPLLHFLLARR
jgi:5-methylcytosine-specific restriction endonuclease McrA